MRAFTAMRRATARWESLLVILIVAGGVWSWTLSSYFLVRANLLDLATPYVYLGLMAFGLTFVVIAGEIDISIASTMTVSAVSFAQLWNHGVNVWIAAILGLLVATGLGLVNGILIGLLDLPSLAVTLGTLAAYRGLAYVILGGQARSGFPTSFTEIGGGYVRTELPVALLVLLGAAILLGILLHATRFGRYLYTLGSNREATRFSGVPDTRVRVTVFTLSGFMAGVAGIVYMGYFGSVQADAASGSELISVVTAVVLGGVDIFGGAGSMLGVFLALILIAVLRNGMQLANVGGAAQDIVVGGLLLGAILAGNVVRAVQGGGLPWRRATRPREEELETESTQVPVTALPTNDPTRSIDA
ncbi:MAG: rhamnose transport system permease protein [Gaiellales bacterium]|nr:rhamnose transport system permease protein [Gaiellales bacterium]